MIRGDGMDEDGMPSFYDMLSMMEER